MQRYMITNAMTPLALQKEINVAAEKGYRVVQILQDTKPPVGAILLIGVLELKDSASKS